MTAQWSSALDSKLHWLENTADHTVNSYQPSCEFPSLLFRRQVCSYRHIPWKQKNQKKAGLTCKNGKVHKTLFVHWRGDCRALQQDNWRISLSRPEIPCLIYFYMCFKIVEASEAEGGDTKTWEQIELIYSGKSMDLEGSVHDLDKSRCKRQRRTSEQAIFACFIRVSHSKIQRIQRDSTKIYKAHSAAMREFETGLTWEHLHPTKLHISNAGSREKLTNVQHHAPQNGEI